MLKAAPLPHQDPTPRRPHAGLLGAVLTLVTLTACADESGDSTGHASTDNNASASDDVSTAGDPTGVDPTGGDTTGDTTAESPTTGDSTTSDPTTEAAPPPAADLVLPEVIALPYVVAGEGGTSILVPVTNLGDADALAPGGGPLVFTLEGDPGFSLVSAPTTVAADGNAFLELAWAGAATEQIATATLQVTTTEASHVAAVHAVAGDPALGAAVWEPVTNAAGEPCGEGTTIALPTAPFPHASGPWTDPSVRIFVPKSYRDLPAQDLVVHFHGHLATLAETLADHRYQEQVWASGSNVILVVPQGPVEALSGNFGKLMDPGGLAALVDQVLVVLYREQRIFRPGVGEVALTSHSGGYRAVAANLDVVQPFPIPLVALYDSLYGFVDTYAAHALAGGRLVSNYTANGGTAANNAALATTLAAAGLTVSDRATQRALASADPIITLTDTDHNTAMRIDGIYGDALRFAAGHARRGPRLELRSAVAAEGTATVTWLAPPDRDMTGIRVETSLDGLTWTTATEAPPDAQQATFPLDGGARVRVSGVVPYTATPLASDSFRVDEGATLLSVDGFDRIIDGSFGQLSHDFAARLGEAAGPVHTVSHRALIEDGFDLAPYESVVWLLGDESTMDRPFDAAERALATDYLDAGGRLLVSGSEVAYVLDTGAPAWLGDVFGAALLADDSGSLLVKGAGPLAGLGPLMVGGANAPYAEDYPDALSVSPGAQALLTYEMGTAAAVGRPDRAALVGFPLELVTAPDDLAALLTGLLATLQ